MRQCSEASGESHRTGRPRAIKRALRHCSSRAARRAVAHAVGGIQSQGQSPFSPWGFEPLARVPWPVRGPNPGSNQPVRAFWTNVQWFVRAEVITLRRRKQRARDVIQNPVNP